MDLSNKRKATLKQLSFLGVMCGLAAGVWLGAQSATGELVFLNISPFVMTAATVIGVFVARWSLPTMIKGTTYVFTDIGKSKHLIVWGVLAGALWGIASTLTFFAIKDVGLVVAVPIWNSNSIIGLIWGIVLFNELRGAKKKQLTKAIGGVFIMVIAMIILSIATTTTGATTGMAIHGLLAALGAGLLYGTMYIPYRKAYLSGMNPLSFVTIFTVGEIITVVVIGILFLGGSTFGNAIITAGPVLFWVFLGGAIWVVGDLFQQFACKYIGIGRGIPLANTNQLWSTAWAALVFMTMRGFGVGTITAIISGVVVMVIGAALLASAQPETEERKFWNKAILRECKRYKLDKKYTLDAVDGKDPLGDKIKGLRWWDYLILVVAVGIFAVLACFAVIPPLPMNPFWLMMGIASLVVSLVWVGWLLKKYTGFS